MYKIILHTNFEDSYNAITDLDQSAKKLKEYQEVIAAHKLVVSEFNISDITILGDSLFNTAAKAITIANSLGIEGYFAIVKSANTF